MESTKTLTANKIAQLNELVNVRKISDLSEAPDILDGGDSSVLYNSYVLTSTYLSNSSKYINYKLKLNKLTDYLNGVGHDEIEAFKINFNNFISNLVENTRTSYIRFEKVEREGADANELNYSYTITPNYSTINQIASYFDEDHKYVYTDQLTEGLITNDVLEQYVRDTMGRILGVPNTQAAVDDAINSVIEFIDWFKDYEKNEDGLRALINRIDAKDSEIVNSYQAADQSIITNYNAADNKIINSYTNADTKIITSYQDADANLQQQINDINTAMGDLDVPVKGVDNEHTKSFIIGSTQYTLKLISSGMLLIDELNDTYVDFDWVSGYPDPSSIGSKEYDKDGTGTTDTKSITLKFKVNKDGYVDGSSSNWGSTYTNGYAITANIEYKFETSYTVNTSKTFSIKITENALSQQDISFGHTAQSKNYSITNQYTKFGVWIFSSTSEITSDVFSLNGSLELTATNVTINNVKKLLWANKTSISDTIDIGNSNEYVYVLIPSNWITPSYKFFWGGSTTPEDANLVCNTVKLYSNDKVYYLYRSLRIQTGNEFKVEYKNPS